jgi:putative ABC transport system ATP-binding protein
VGSSRNDGVWDRGNLLVDEFHQTIVMVTHDPHAASFADLVLFLADGKIVDSMPEPTTLDVVGMGRFELPASCSQI